MVLKLDEVSVRYGRSVQALRGVGFEVAQGEVLAVLGSNGAGKSTLLRAVSGTLRLHGGALTSGSISFQDKRIDGLDPAAIVRRRLLQVPEGRQVFGRMSVEENLRVGGLSADPKRRAAARDRVYDLFPRLKERSEQPGGLLSGGEQQMLAIARALMCEPTLLLLDEPSLGLAPQMIDRIGSIVGDINATGTAVVLVEQNATMALRVAHRAVVLEVGELALSGTAAELAASEDVQRLYLGGHAETHAATHTETHAGDDPGPDAADRGAHRVRRTLSVWRG